MRLCPSFAPAERGRVRTKYRPESAFPIADQNSRVRLFRAVARSHGHSKIAAVGMENGEMVYGVSVSARPAPALFAIGAAIIS